MPFMVSLTAAEALDGLDDEQRAVAQALHGPVVVLAGAGTGKTRAITHRIAHGVATGEHDPRRSLAVTFTTRAAGEMRSRLRELGELMKERICGAQRELGVLVVELVLREQQPCAWVVGLQGDGTLEKAAALVRVFVLEL